MHPKKIEHIASIIDKISKGLIPPRSNIKGRHRLISSHNELFILIGDVLDAYEDLLLKLLSDENWERKFSEKYVEKKLRKIVIFNRVEEQYDLLKEIRILEEHYEKYNTIHQVYIPLVGVKAPNEPIQIGNIQFVLMTNELKNEIINKVNAIITKTTSPEDNQVYMKKYLEENLSGLEGKSFSVFEVLAEPIRARERAEIETKRAIDLLRYSVPSLYSNDYEVKVGLLGDVPKKTTRFEPTLALDNSNFSLNKEIAGPIVPFQFNEKNLKIMEDIGVFVLSEILQNTNDNIKEIESALLRGIHWLGNSTIDNDIENSFLNLVICLETFLTPRNRDPIASSIGEGVAFALAEDVESRKRIKKKIKDFYNKRSGISHGGDKSVHIGELVYLQRLTISFTVWLIDNIDKFNSVKDLLNWVEDQKLS